MLLTGVGGDNLFTGSMFFFADWLTRGCIWPAAREMAQRAAMGRVSFWELAYRNALLPILPRGVRGGLVNEVGTVPPWMRRTAVRRYALRERAVAPSSYTGRIDHKYQHAVAAAVAVLGGALSYEVIEDSLDVRHPFLYRPLVEFALGLPPQFCARANARKWVLREAMRGILPNAVRTRVGKGAPNGRLAWSLAAQRELLKPLVANPILADLGVVDPKKLRAAFEAAEHERETRSQPFAAMQETLAIEAWLEMRSGRWPRETTYVAEQHYGTLTRPQYEGIPRRTV